MRDRCVQGVGKCRDCRTGVCRVGGAGSASPTDVPAARRRRAARVRQRWLPGGHEAYWRQIEDDVVQVSQLCDGARFFWAVPDYVPADQVAALPGLVRPEVTERMATLVVQGTTPGRAADHAL